MDWVTWPLFSIYLIALVLMFFRGGKRLLGVKMHTIIVLLIIIASIGIAMSLYHDSSDILKLYY